jgi:Zn-dependent protease
MGHLTIVQEVMVWILPVLFAVTVHEVAHGWVANKLGDRTAFMMGRLTLNPIKHIDIVGTVVVPILCLFLGGFVFGWAKPVPVSWRNLKKPRRDAALVAVAGPLSNLLMALLWALIAKGGVILFQQGFSSAVFLAYMGYAGISINLMLMILNLLPIPPLDGSRVVSSLLPMRLARSYDAIEPYGMMILVALIFTKVLSMILIPPLESIQTLIVRLFGL